jgi:uncharacterized membrane protein
MGVLTDLLTVALVTGLFWFTPVLARPTLPFGVRVPGDRVDEPAVWTQRHRYGRRVLATGALGAAVVTVLAVLSAPPTARAGVVAAAGLADMAFFLAASRAVRTAKAAGDWYAGARQAVTTDTTLRTDPVRLPWAVLAPAVLVLLGTAVAGVLRYPDLPTTLAAPHGAGVDPSTRQATSVATAFAPVFQQAVITLLVPLCAAGALRARPDLDAAAPVGSAARYRRYLRAVVVLLFATSALANLSFAVIAWQVWELVPPGPIATAALAAPLVVAGIAWVVFVVRVGDAGHRLATASDSSGYVQRDDDQHWFLGGTVYGNRSDPAVLVHHRVGTGWTLNLGHPAAWAVLGALAVLAVLAATGVVDLPSRS